MIFDDIPEKIQKIYNSCSASEQKYLLQILKELSESDMGYSQTYTDIWLADYKEIPVDIDTFLNSPAYLGLTNREGQAVYPFWRKELQTVFNAGNKYYEWIFTGATRIGKSSTAITATAYMLYRLMCLRDPQKFFNKKEISTFSILFFNVTIDLAKSVAYREFQDTILACPWMLAHGTQAGSEKNPYFIPEGGKISIDVGSGSSHALGQQVYVGFCLVGSTKIVTAAGVKTLQELDSCPARVKQLHLGEIIWSDAFILQTDKVNITVRITLSDGTEIEGTPEHRLLKQDGEYCSLQDLELNAHILTIDHIYAPLDVVRKEVIHHDEPVDVYDVINALPAHNFIIQGNSQIVSHNCDEVNFMQAGVKDINKAKKKMKDTYNTIAARVKGTFKHGGEVFGKIFSVSSKNSDNDFMEDYIQEQLAAGSAEHMYISDAPQWDVLPPDTFSKKKFFIAVGDRHHKGFVVPDNQTHEAALEDLKTQGYKILTPPVDMKSDFLADFEIALRDLAGIAVPGAMSYITQAVITSCINESRHNPFYQDILEIGVHDSYTIEEFFHMNEITPEIKRSNIYIHLDLALNTDRAGISGCGIIGRKDITNELTQKIMSMPIVGHAFSLAIQAPRGDKIPYDKILRFIIWLRKQGFHIAVVSRDQFQSEYMGQLLEQNGFEEEKISLDRTPDPTRSARRPRTPAASRASKCSASSTNRRPRRSPTASKARRTSWSRSTTSAAARSTSRSSNWATASSKCAPPTATPCSAATTSTPRSSTGSSASSRRTTPASTSNPTRWPCSA